MHLVVYAVASMFPYFFIKEISNMHVIFFLGESLYLMFIVHTLECPLRKIELFQSSIWYSLIIESGCIEQRLFSVGLTQGRVGYGSIYTSVGPRTKIPLFCFSLHGTVQYLGMYEAKWFLDRFCFVSLGTPIKVNLKALRRSISLFLKLLQSWLQHK